MKNIFILPTDKPSRLYFWTGNNIYKSQFRLREIAGFCTNSETTTNQHIYITKKEEINIGDYYLCKLTMKPLKCIGDEYFNNIDEEKIILTTDLDLIKYGIQEVDDKFLEWFCENTSCEWVEVISFEKYTELSGEKGYEVILPAEKS